MRATSASFRQVVRVWVQSEKIYFRLGKLKCKVTMTDEAGEAVCRGTLAGMILEM